MELEHKSYGKSELAMLYFPGSSPSVALKRLNRWINHIDELKTCLSSCHLDIKSKHWSRKQVEYIAYYLGEP